MTGYMIILRLIHIFTGVFWAGGIFFLVSFVQPSVAATGAEGQKFMQHLGLRTRLSPAFAAAAALTVISGILMYERIYQFQPDKMTSGSGLVLALGGIAGIVAWAYGYAVTYRSIQRMKALSAEILAAGGPPKPEQQAQMQALSGKVTQGSRLTAVILTIAVIGMATAQYLQ